MRSKLRLSIFSASLIAALIASCDSNKASQAYKVVTHSDDSGEVYKVERSFYADFNSIQAATGLSVTYVQGSPAKVEIEGRQQDMDDLDIYTRNNGLYMAYKSKTLNRGKKRMNLHITVTAPDVNEFDCSTGVSLHISGLQTSKKVEIDMGTGGTLRAGTIVAPKVGIDFSTGASGTLESVQTKETDIDISTGASLTISGRSEEAYIDASTGATIDASRFINEYAKVDASVGATVTVNAARTTTDSSVGATVRNVRP